MLTVEAIFSCLIFVASSATARLCLSLGSQAIAVHRARVPVESHEQVLQSSLNTAFGVHVYPGSFKGIFDCGGSVVGPTVSGNRGPS